MNTESMANHAEAIAGAAVIVSLIYFGVPGAAIPYEALKLGMFFIVAINTEQLPVTTVIGITVMTC